jgi:YD repeat-containing protein
VTAGTPRDASGTATLTVDPPAGGQQHSLLGTDQGRTEQTVVVRTDGTFLVRLVITNPAFSKEFAPAGGGLLVPEPTTTGRSWSWTATSTDGKTKAAVTAKVTGRETLMIGGVATPTTTIDSTLRLTGDIDYTGHMQYWYDAAHRLQAKDHTRGSGTVGGIAFTSDITSVLQSTRPS